MDSAMDKSMAKRLFNLIINKETVSGLFWLGIASILLFGGLLLFISSLSEFTPAFIKILSSHFFIVSTLVLFAFWMFNLLIKADIDRRKFYIILSALVATTMIFRFIYVYSLDQQLVSDFLTMWNRAIYIVENGWVTPHSPQTERPVAWFLPLVWLFGSSVYVYEISNVMAITLQNLLIAILARHWCSNNAGLVAFVVLSAVPEIHFASLITTHDIPGGLYLVMYIFFQFKLFDGFHQKNNLTVVIYLIALCVIGLLLELQRSTFTLVMMANFIFFTFHFLVTRDTYDNWHRIRRYLVVVLLPVVFMTLTKPMLMTSGVMFDRSNPGIIYNSFSRFCNQHSFSMGSFGNCRSFYDQYAVQLNHENIDYYASAITLSDLYYNAVNRPENYLYRIQRLSQLGTQAGFYYGRLQNVDPRFQRQINWAFSTFNNTFVALFAFAMLIALGFLLFSRSFRSKTNVYALYPILIVSIGVLAFGLMSENQPRYLFFGWPLWVLTAVVVLLSGTRDINVPVNSFHVRVGIMPIGLAIVGALFVVVAFAQLAENSEKRLIEMSAYSNVRCSSHFTDNECAAFVIPIKRSFEEKSYSNLKLKHPTGLFKGAKGAVIYELPVSAGEVYRLSMFVQSPYMRKDKRTGYFSVNIYVDDKLYKSLPVADNDKDVYVEINDLVAINDAMSITLELQSKVGNQSASWLRASEVNFKFMALRKQ